MTTAHTLGDIAIAAGVLIVLVIAGAAVADFVISERARAEDRRRNLELVGPPTVTDEPLPVNYFVEADTAELAPTLYLDDATASAARRVFE